MADPICVLCVQESGLGFSVRECLHFEGSSISKRKLAPGSCIRKPKSDYNLSLLLLINRITIQFYVTCVFGSISASKHCARIICIRRKCTENILVHTASCVRCCYAANGAHCLVTIRSWYMWGHDRRDYVRLHYKYCQRLRHPFCVRFRV